MIKKFITLFKLGRKIASSDILDIISKFQKPPLAITLLFKFLSISFSPKKKDSNKADAILIASFYYETHQKED